MRRSTANHLNCSVARSLEILGEWWTLLIVRDAFFGVRRFDDFINDLGISRGVLTDRLATLVEHEILVKRRYHEAPDRFEYRLTDKGRDLFPVLMTLMQWGDKWLSTPEVGTRRARQRRRRTTTHDHHRRCRRMTLTRLADKPITTDRFNAAGDGNHHGWLGFDVTRVDAGLVVAEMTVRADQLNPGAGLHGGVSASFADSLCGYGTFTCLPDGAEGFTTVSLSANYLGKAVLDDTLVGTARLVKGGRQLQVWDVNVVNGSKAVAEVRITQLLRYAPAI